MVTLLLLCSFVFVTGVVSQEDNVCHRPELSANVEVSGLQRYYNPGAEIVLSCEHGYIPLSSPRRIVCGASGEWTKTKMKCIPKQCPYPDQPINGEVYYDDNVYQSTVNYTCNEGYILHGVNTSVCLADGTWSATAPECKTVTCGLAPIPEFGMVVYDRRISGNATDYGFGATYTCLPPYALFGNPRAECTASGTWTKTPVCRVVTCPPPENIANGYMSSTDQRDFDFMETVKYGCNGHYMLEGSFQIVCQQNGHWSEKPSCKRACQVGIQRGRILYKGRKMWIKELTPNRILHRELVSVYCKDEARQCGYAVSIQCIDGNLPIPECYQEPSSIEYNLRSGSLPSEIRQC